MPMPRKPEALKAVAGTQRADRAPPPGAADVPPISALPKMPNWLPNGHAAEIWNRLGPILLQHKLLTEANTDAFAHLCASHGIIVEIYAAKTFPPAALMGQYRQLLTEFGLTPASASKARSFGPPGEDTGNAFSRNGQQRAA